ncbi:damage-control phosphatase ARMT1 [Nilaparvata lugens]|uniref:damage-control phosphatase ARMT1 n=1 Tax=Nilaparvata lugens TaxID=108931 RepID=UPI00193D6E92|nr:damage-control phosphatase ARMT1 [Nilaparvata lugens]XP_039280605.1 damage-control phosphatase ARMT1 [Nilaparvata lugens]XP_039280606.1 damage-control phosphatase ARMT1 [Nilaparvata lugens]XP_039280607.1 damage-control phosphatase ARMT1 [Nilaparvata lugens]XP_039280608.1 damage-control phosphatase ARMT1 [Nilaparvata lugens]XP_039280609.1 damage-control phosphatase ARMT1 [Nilaparvata lugens]XP_039280610.1 damage-control phosphatase ARMT1 [Nilaparvata lugens]
MGQVGFEDCDTPLNTRLSARYKRSFAYPSFKDRVPVILTKVIDHLVRDKESIIAHFGEKAREEVKKVIGCVSQMKNELQTDKPLTELSSLGSDHELWNRIFREKSKEYSRPPSWFQTEWLYAECYLYRRLHEAFLQTEAIRHLDPFHWQKTKALDNSLIQAEILAQRMNKIVSNNHDSSELEQLFHELLKISLWGNKCDLSLSGGTEISLQDDPLNQVSQFDSFILADDTKCVLKHVANTPKGTIDFVLDNAGYEVFTDLCLAEFLVTKYDERNVLFRTKAFPWYVSDVIAKDIHYILNTLKEKKGALADCADRWQSLFDSGKFKIVENQYWTTPHVYADMEEIDPKLYAELKESKLIIFKGDLNYRKLVSDINWPPTTAFSQCLKGFHPAALVTLRTLKCDTIGGLPPGKAEEAAARSQSWMLTGDFAVIQFHS